MMCNRRAVWPISGTESVESIPIRRNGPNGIAWTDRREVRTVVVQPLDGSTKKIVAIDSLYEVSEPILREPLRATGVNHRHGTARPSRLLAVHNAEGTQ